MRPITVKWSAHAGDVPCPVAAWPGSPLLALRLLERLRGPSDGHILRSKAQGSVHRAVVIPAWRRSPDKNPIPSGRAQCLAVSTVCARWRTLASVRVLCIPWSWNLRAPAEWDFSGLSSEDIFIKCMIIYPAFWYLKQVILLALSYSERLNGQARSK